LIDPPDKVYNKCTGDLKNKPLVGMIILKDMKKNRKCGQGVRLGIRRRDDPGHIRFIPETN
jgi:hypothetical protein